MVALDADRRLFVPIVKKLSRFDFAFCFQDAAASDLLDLLEESTKEEVGGLSDICEKREQELQQIIDYIHQMYQQYDLSTPEYQKKLPCLEAKYKVRFCEQEARVM